MEGGEKVIGSRYHYNFQIVEFNTKANTLDNNSMDAIFAGLRQAEREDNALIIINDAMQFSEGVNLRYVMELAKNKEWKKIEKFISDFQKNMGNYLSDRISKIGELPFR